MNNFCNDIIACIIKELSYTALLQFTSSCKKFMLLQQSNYFIKKKDQYHNPDEDFQVSPDIKFPDDNFHIHINQIYLAVIWKNGQLYNFQLTNNILSGNKLNYPFEFADTTWNKIKYRFRELDIKELYEYVWIRSSKFRGHRDKNYVINQIKLLYYTFKYFKIEMQQVCTEL